jgi:glycosyltransferase involved in cell wall biosynthesis
MNTPVISILMSVYNGEKYLRNAVNSILDQTITDFEFIIINDGSTDKSREILESYHDDRIVLLHQQNAGLTKSLSTGLSLARGEYVARIDADDLAKPSRLENQLQFLSKHPKVMLVGSNCYNIDENGSVLSLTDLPVDEVHIKWNLLFYNCLRHSTVMFRRKEVTNLGGYNTTIPYAQDYDLWLRIAGKYSVANLKEPLVYLRVPREGTITYDKIDEQAQHADQIYLNVLRTLDPEITRRENEVRALKKYIFSDGELNDIGRAEKLFIRIYSAFCNSSFTVNINKDRLNRIVYAPYVKFAWSYFNQGNLDMFDHCVAKVMDSGFRGPFEIPADDLYQKEEFTFKALNKYFLGNKQDVASRVRKKFFFSRQYAYLAWNYYSMGEMRQFRRCLSRSFRNHPSPGGAVLLLKSLLGRRTIEGIHRLRLMFDDRLPMSRMSKNDKQVV